MRGWITLWIAALGLAAVPARGQGVGAYYKNKRWGYKVRAPDGFKSAALSASEEWIASKHIARRAVYAKRSAFVEADYPQMWVIGFPHKRQEERGAKVTKEGDTTKITFRNPYKDYKDFVRRERWFVGGGYYFSKEEEGVWKGMKVTKCEIKVEKMVESPYRIVAWVYHFDDIDFAVQCKVLEDYYKKYRVAFTACLKSFRRIDRTGALPGAASTGEKVIRGKDESKMSREEKQTSRRERFERTLNREIEALPKGWYVLRSKRYVALSDASRRFTRKVLNHAEAIRGYLEKTLGGIGEDYVPPGILRIFETDAERNAYTMSTSTTWFDWAEQAVISEESSKGLKSWAMGSVSESVTSQWLSFKNSLLNENMPGWFRWGLQQHMRFARVKGKSVTIKPDEWDREQIKELIKSGRAIAIKTLFERGDNEQSFGMQCGSVISYLLAKGNRGKTRDVVRRYMENLIAAIEKAEKEYEAEKEKLDQAVEDAAGKEGDEAAPESENEEGENEEGADNAYFEKLREAMKKKITSIRKQAFDATFGSLTDKDWKRLDRAWRSYAG